MSERLARSIARDLGGEYALHHHAHVQLSHAQLLTLVTVPVQILAAPGPNRATRCSPCYGGAEGLGLLFNWAANYTNVSTQAGIDFWHGTNGPASRYLANDFLAWGESVLWFPAMPDRSGGGSNMNDDEDLINQPLYVSLNNGGQGNLTGGAAGNTIDIYFQYQILDLSLGRFV